MAPAECSKVWALLLGLVLCMALAVRSEGSEAFVGTASNGSLLLQAPGGQDVMVDGVAFRSVLERLDALTRRVGGFATCLKLKVFGASLFSGAGVYTLHTMSGVPFQAYCNDDGWTLIRNQVDPDKNFKYTSPAHALQNLSDAGVQEHLDTIIPHSSAMRYTDARGTIIVEALVDGTLYWSRVTSSACGLVPVQYTRGVLSGGHSLHGSGPKDVLWPPPQ